MLLDHVVPKPPTIKGYKLHQLVQGLTGGDSPLFVDMGDRLVVRTEKLVTEKGQPIRVAATGDIVGFELRACVSKKIKGQRVYYPVRDWRSRHAWLQRQGQRHGFEPMTMNSHSSYAEVDNEKGRAFTVDQTDFVGVLRVTDSKLFEKAVVNGVGSTAKTFGFGMLVL